MMERNAKRGFPGCMGSLDCTHWEWHQCSTGMEGAYRSRNGSRGVVVAAVCDEDLWIWHVFFGAPGSFNDPNLLSNRPFTSSSRPAGGRRGKWQYPALGQLARYHTTLSMVKTPVTPP